IVEAKLALGDEPEDRRGGDRLRDARDPKKARRLDGLVRVLIGPAVPSRENEAPLIRDGERRAGNPVLGDELAQQPVEALEPRIETPRRRERVLLGSPNEPRRSSGIGRGEQRAEKSRETGDAYETTGHREELQASGSTRRDAPRRTSTSHAIKALTSRCATRIGSVDPRSRSGRAARDRMPAEG